MRAYEEVMVSFSENRTAALLMIGSMAAFTVNDTIIKSLSDDVPLFQAIFLRGVLASILLFGLCAVLKSFQKGIARRDWAAVSWRTLSEAGAAYFFISALYNMPLANATAILQALPLTVTLAGALFLGETVGWRRMTAILIGFVGVLLIVRPGMAGFNIYSLYCLAAVACVTARDIATRKLTKDTDSMVVTLVSSINVTLFAGLMSLGETWGAITPEVALTLLATAVSILFAYLFSVMVMRVGDISFVAPFRYTALLFAIVLGYFAFGDWPDNLTLLGSAILVATGLFSYMRERKLALQRSA